MRVLVPLPIMLPLVGAALSLTLHRRVALQRTLGVGVLAATVVASVALLAVVHDDGPGAVDVGAWRAPIGITLVADLFAAGMLVVSALMLLAVLVYAIGSPRTADQARFFHPVYLVLAAGVAASFLTGDLFNLFVAFEVMLVASYVLITLGGSGNQVRTGMTYVVVSLVASLLFVTAVAMVYAATGTVNLAQLAERVPDLPDGLRTALSLLLLVVFGIKAAIFPLFFWLPDSYPTAPTPVTAIFAGLLTKVGVYAIIRTQTLLFGDGGPSEVLLFVAGATMLVGVLGAIAQDDVKRILSFHIISQIGYMVMGLGLFTVAGLAGAAFYITHHIVVKTALFLVGGIIEDIAGTGALRRIGGMVHRAPLVGALFLLPALSLAGLPPFSGFFAKLALVQAGLATEHYVIVGVSLLVSLLTLFSMTKIWAGVFWGTPDEPMPERVRPEAPNRRLMIGATAALVGISLAIAVGAEPVYDLSRDAAEQLHDPAVYIATVLER
ncbi:MAG TPA: Na+/H+ antiporter subunit D [Acidimicrobiales bacterium]|nr:Na+/H+ antiporter subunit D [Acidimicrobiales bacterium]